MHRRVHITLGVLLVALAGVSVWQGLRLREPVYQGKGLSVWLEILDKQMVRGTDGYGPKSYDERDWQAVRQIGTNALPVLIERLQAQDTRLKQLMMRWAKELKLVSFHFKPADQRRREAGWGYKALGPLASAHVPILSHFLTSDPSPEVRQVAAWALAYIEPDARLATPALFRAMKDTDDFVRCNALSALCVMRPDGGLMIPVLVAGLGDSAECVRMTAAHALGEYGPEARAAVPALLRTQLTNLPARFVLKNGDYVVADQFDHFRSNNAARFALKAIDPEAAAKAGVR